MGWLYEVTRLLGIKIERKEIERIIQGEADPEEIRDTLATLKPLVEHGPPELQNFNTEEMYQQACKEYKKFCKYYDAITSNNQ